VRINVISGEIYEGHGVVEILEHESLRKMVLGDSPSFKIFVDEFTGYGL
jgi:hypothetical protein